MAHDEPGEFAEDERRVKFDVATVTEGLTQRSLRLNADRIGGNGGHSIVVTEADLDQLFEMLAGRQLDKANLGEPRPPHARAARALEWYVGDDSWLEDALEAISDPEWKDPSGD